MKRQFPMHLYHVQWRNDTPDYMLLNGKDSSDSTFTLVGPVTVECEVPDDFDPRPAKVASIDAQIQKLRAEHQNRLTELIRKRSELLAIDAPAAVEDSIPGHSVPF